MIRVGFFFFSRSVVRAETTISCVVCRDRGIAIWNRMNNLLPFMSHKGRNTYMAKPPVNTSTFAAPACLSVLKVLDRRTHFCFSISHHMRPILSTIYSSTFRHDTPRGFGFELAHTLERAQQQPFEVQDDVTLQQTTDPSSFPKRLTIMLMPHFPVECMSTAAARVRQAPWGW